MRLRKKAWAKPEMEKDHKTVFNPSEWKGKWSEHFGNSQPIHLELGCGRGRFINELARMNSEINYIAIDVHPELLVYVLRKVNELKLNNIRIVPMYIEKLGDVFTSDEIEKIYINFCNPWPNKRHHKRRLTYPNFLRMYQACLKQGSEIWFKTDDDSLFADSLEYFQETGFTEIFKSADLEQSGYQDNILTEYEEKFIQEGIKIKFGQFKYKTEDAVFYKFI